MLSTADLRPEVVLPVRFRDRTLDTFEGSPTAAAAARRLATGQITNLVLSGPTGVGKTHLAAGIARLWWEREWQQFERKRGAERLERDAEIAALVPWERIRWRVRQPEAPVWVNVAEAMSNLRSEIGGDERPAEESLRRLRDHGSLVVLDDLGREKVSDWTSEVVYVLVNCRYESMVPTVVTTNLTGAELAASSYWPVISRLAEGGGLIRIEAADRRLRRA